MKQQNFPSWLDLKITEVGITMKWENKFQHWSLNFAFIGVPWEPMEQPYSDRSQVHNTTLGLLLLLYDYCSHCRETQLHASDYVRCEFSWEWFSTLQPAKAMPCLGSSCAYYQYFGPLLYGSNLKHAAFMVSIKMWYQRLEWDQCYGTFSEPNMCLKSKPETRKWNVQSRHTSYPACDNTVEPFSVKYGIS